jgi:pimeloyl-ACP methyl ester carboxylesterase
MAKPVTHRHVACGEVTLHVAEQGSGPAVVLLHGFPEHWYSWRHQMAALADAGYRALAVDLRGFNLSDKPHGIANYRMDTVARDIVGLLDALSIAQADIVAHDWGGTVGWYLASRHASRVRSHISLNSPHPTRFLKLLVSSRQLFRSWYMFVFQVPWLPERLMAQPGFATRALRGMAVHKDRFPDEELAHFDRAINQPGAATCMLNYYRAGLRYPDPIKGKVHVPTQVIWGEQDEALGVECLDGLERYVDDLRIHRIADASHWVQQDTPDEVNRVLLQFLAARRGAQPAAANP